MKILRVAADVTTWKGSISESSNQSKETERPKSENGLTLASFFTGSKFHIFRIDAEDPTTF